MLEGLERRRSHEYVGSFFLSLVCVGLEDYDRALSLLQEGAQEQEPLMTFINQTPLVDPLRSDPRFQALLQRMNFPQQT